jgi:histidyl-tRNA synthetase
MQGDVFTDDDARWMAVSPELTKALVQAVVIPWVTSM